MIIFSLTLLLITSWWLKCYTRHGQSIELPDFTGKTMAEAEQMARSHDFELIKQDSTFFVDKPGSIVLRQAPKPGSLVKEDRKVYLVVTKHNADLVSVSMLPRLYGQSFDVKKSELQKGFEFKSNIVGYTYDAGPKDYIMAVIYQGDTIISSKIEQKEYKLPKGATLDFVLSSNTGAEIPIPNVVCMTYPAATFLLTSMGLIIQEIEEDVIDHKESSYVIHQEPLYDQDTRIHSGDTVRIFLNLKKPDPCPN
ncbi:MAG: PASTA domain-containing protein [Saprospiraceae bacterium]